MAYNMEPLILECVYPFPDAGIPCPACGRRQKRPSLFNCHAKKVHHTLNTETPTTCSGCGKHFPSYKAASAHYSRAHVDSKKSKAPSPSSSRATSPSCSIPSLPGDTPPSPAPTSPTKPASQPPTVVGPKVTKPKLSLTLHKPTSPPCVPKLLSPIAPTQEIIKNFLQDLPPPTPPQILTDSSSACLTTAGTATTSSPCRAPPNPAPPIPLHSRRTIIPPTPTSIDDFLHSIRATTRQQTPPHRTRSPSPSLSNSPPTIPAPTPSETAKEFEDNLALLRSCLLDEPTSTPTPVSPPEAPQSSPPAAAPILPPSPLPDSQPAHRTSPPPQRQPPSRPRQFSGPPQPGGRPGAAQSLPRPLAPNLRLNTFLGQLRSAM